MAKIAKRQNRSQRSLRKMLGCSGVTEVDRKAHNDYHAYAFGISSAQRLGI